jgi:hypothetical protein
MSFQRALRDLVFAGVLGAAFALRAVASAPDAPALPSAVVELAPHLRVQGSAEMKFLGFSIYDGWYWALEPGWRMNAPFALDLRYHRSLRGSSIAERSVSEIARFDLATPEELARWGADMHRIFPDVKSGDRMTGLFLPPSTVRFFLNGGSIGEIVDPLYARAFFGIWLDPRTSRPEFRQKLLGGGP